MPRKKIYLTLVFILIKFSVKTQDVLPPKQENLKQNSLQAELGGHGVFLSLNYERIFFPDKKIKTAIQAGASHNFWSFFFPIVVNEIISFNKHHVELGLGYIPAFEGRRFWSFSEMYTTARAGYRYQKPGKNFVFRSGFTPIFGNSYFIPMFGISFGRSF
jgi:hypothetical protein